MKNSTTLSKLAFLFATVTITRADLTLNPNMDHGGTAHANYGGGATSVSGYISPNELFASSGVPLLGCLDCQFDFNSGPLTGTDSGSWYFDGGGSVSLVGGVGLHDTSGLYDDLGLPDIPTGTALFTGVFETIQAGRCDAFDSDEVCISGTFSGSMNPELAQIYGLPVNVDGFLVLNYLVYSAPPFPPFGGCNSFLSCGPFPPDPFEGFSLGGGDSGFVSFSAPEPSGFWLLATVGFLVAAISRLPGIHRARRGRSSPDVDYDRTRS